MSLTVYTYRGRCIRVVDGDTMDLELDLGFYLRTTLRFRLLGIDAPEMRASDPDERVKAQEATNGLRLIMSEVPQGDFPLTVSTAKSDSFGRWLARMSFVSALGVAIDVSDEMLKMGLAAVRLGK